MFIVTEYAALIHPHIQIVSNKMNEYPKFNFCYPGGGELDKLIRKAYPPPYNQTYEPLR